MADQHHAAPTPNGPEPAARTSDVLIGHHRSEPDTARRRRLYHDIQHELATIGLLASILGSAEDVGRTSRQRAEQLLRETHWLGELLQAYDGANHDPAKAPWSPPAKRLRLDALAGEVVAALRLSHPTRVHFVASEAWAYGNRLSLWRALRNVLENAFRASGPNGQVRVRVKVEDGSVVAQVDDDGPGFGAGPAGLASLGLRIVRDVLTEHGGGLEMSASDLGGGCVRLLLPAVSAPDPAERWIEADGDADSHL